MFCSSVPIEWVQLQQETPISWVPLSFIRKIDNLSTKRNFRNRTYITQKEQPMTEGNFGGCGKLDILDWLFFLGYVPFLKLRLVLKLSNMIQIHAGIVRKAPQMAVVFETEVGQHVLTLLVLLKRAFCSFCSFCLEVVSIPGQWKGWG